MKNKFVAIILVIFSLVFFILAPEKYQYMYCLLCGIFYVAMVLVYHILKRKSNYMDFDSFFFFTFFFVMFYYPIFMYETDATRYFMFIFGYDENQIPKGSAMALVGAASYIAGSLFFSKRYGIAKGGDAKTLEGTNGYKKKSTKPLYVISIMLFVAYVATGGYNELASYYTGDKVEESAGISNFLFVLSPAFLFSGIIIDFFNMKKLSPNKFNLKKIDIASIGITGFIFLMMLVAGSRTLPLQIMLLVFGLYANLFKGVGLPRFILMLCGGILLMFATVLFRGYKQDDEFVFSDVVMDLIINNRSSYLASEIVNESGYMYGENMLSTLAAPIPFLQSLLIKSGFKESRLSSSQFFTEYTFGKFEGFGLGTNVVADVYLSWSIIGVVFFMFLLGFIVAKSKFFAKENIYSLAIYGVFMSYAVYLVRAEYFTFMRYMVWSLLIIFLFKSKFKFS